MFKPIKDFITFIQKNTSNSNVGEEVTTMENSNVVNDSVIPTTTEETDKQPNIPLATNGVIAIQASSITSHLDDTDIEEQIKPIKISKTLTRPSTPDFSTDVATTPSFEPPPQADHNHNSQPNRCGFVPEEDDELGDFKNDPMQNSAEDYCSAGSEIEDIPLHSADELATEEEDALEERSFNEVENDNKLFVAVDVDLNSSIASSNNEDPLAIDINALATEADVIINPLDSSTNDEKIEVASNGEIVWYDTGDVENAEAAQNGDQNLSAESVQTKPSVGEDPQEETERNDNSDSGLGTETSSLLLQTTIDNSITESTAGYADDQYNRSYEKPNSSRCVVDGRKSIGSCNSGNLIFAATTSNNTKHLHTVASTPKAVPTADLRSCTPTARKPLRSNLKRRICDVDATLSEDEGAANTRSTQQDAYHQPKKPKRSITFDAVQVYYFPRQQGFGCVPSAGGCTLGMGAQHVDSRRLSLAEHAAELRRAHRLQLQEINPRGSSSEDTDESEEDYLSEGSGSDLDADSNGFLQPVSPKQRRALLKAAGVRKIDTSEKIDCRNIRNSREVCGCTCRDFCDAETCTCSRAGIKCQVDRAMFPCGCSRDGCGNTTGRVEFNPARVRTHFIHTIMRLEMENRQQQPTVAGYDATTGLLLPHSANNGVVPAANYYNSILPQSNYSSGYASPAYTNDAGANYLQQQSMLYPNHHNETIAVANSAEQYHSLDNIDGGNIYATTTNTTPSYGEILPNYAITPPMGPPYNHRAQSLNFPTSSYLSYQQQQQPEHPQHHTQQSNLPAAANYLTQPQQSNDTCLIGHSSYSSCAVPSRPPYGTATTCSTTLATPPSTTTSDTNFISLNTPIASSSRLSQINDLLQHNRNTTAALVAVSTNNCPPAVNLVNNSIETPPLNESPKACFVFDTDLSLSGTLSNKPQSRLLSPQPLPPPQSEPPPIASANDSLCNFNGGSSGGCNYPF